MRIEMATEKDLDAYVAHVGRNMLESGRDGSPVFHPIPADQVRDRLASRREAMAERWDKPLSECGWSRAWLLRDGAQVVGHAHLRGGEPSTRAHRAELGMGIERAHIGQGHGARLLRTAIDWARAQGLGWIDLGVFSENLPAQRLYAKLGFVETGRKADLFRIDGQSIDDIEMSLRL